MSITALTPHGMALNRADYFPRPKDARKPKPLKPLFHIADEIGLTKHEVECTKERAFAKIAAAMTTAGFDEFLPVAMAFLLKYDEDWRNYGPGRPPKDHVEYLRWHRNRREQAALVAEAKRRSRAEADALAEMRRRDQAQKELEAKWRERDLIRVATETAPARLLYTPEERRQARLESRARAKAQEKLKRVKAQTKRMQRELAIETKAFELLDRVCVMLGADRDRVSGSARTQFLGHVRQVFACIARDTAYCGGRVSYPVMAGVIGRATAHSCAMEAHKRGMLNYETCVSIRAICDQLGIAAPAYAVAAKEGSAS